MRASKKAQKLEFDERDTKRTCEAFTSLATAALSKGSGRTGDSVLVAVSRK